MAVTAPVRRVGDSDLGKAQKALTLLQTIIGPSLPPSGGRRS